MVSISNIGRNKCSSESASIGILASAYSPRDDIRHAEKTSTDVRPEHRAEVDETFRVLEGYLIHKAVIIVVTRGKCFC